VLRHTKLPFSDDPAADGGVGVVNLLWHNQHFWCVRSLSRLCNTAS